MTRIIRLAIAFISTFVLIVGAIAAIYIKVIEPYKAATLFSEVASLSVWDIDRIYRDFSIDGYEVNWFFSKESKIKNVHQTACTWTPFTTHEDTSRLIQRDVCRIAQHVACHKDGGVDLYRLYQLRNEGGVILTYEKSRETKALCRA